MRVIFANICQGLLYEGKKGKSEAYSKFWPSVYAEQYAALEPDVLCLAEAPMDNRHGSSAFLDDLADRIGAKSLHADVHGESWLVEGKWYGMATLSRYELTNYQSVPMTDPGLEVDRPDGSHLKTRTKTLQFARMQAHGREFKLFNLHYYPIWYFKRRLGEAEFAPMRQQLADALALDEDAPMIVAGDFNNGGGDLADEFPELMEGGKLRSAVNFSEEDFDELYVGGKYQMDHILYSPTVLAVSGGSVVRDRSDHHGVVADFEVL